MTKLLLYILELNNSECGPDNKF